MSAANAPPQPAQPVRIAPWRGPLHFGLLVISATVSLALQITYLLLVVGAFLWLCWQGYLLTGGMARAGVFQWGMIPELLKIGVMGVTWFFMLRPLRPRPQRAGVTHQVTAATQPQLFELIHTLCWHLRAVPPAQVWLDTTITVRSSLSGGLYGLLTGQTKLHLGLPLVSVITAREFGGLLAHELSHNAGGVGTVFVHAVREMNAWFFRAVMERDEWEMHLPKHPKKESGIIRLVRGILSVWMWAAKVPFMVFAIISRMTSAVTRWLVKRSAERTAKNVIGPRMHESLQWKLSLLGSAWKAAKQEIQRGVIQHRLPENLSLFMARHVAAEAKEKASTRAQAGGAENQRDTRHASPKGEAIVARLSPTQPAASVLRQFVGLSRQVTSFYYQQDLGLNLHEHRMVADEEVIHQNRREEEAMIVIRRYFGGLAHPERALCGLGSTPAGATTRAELQHTIQQARDQVNAWGPLFKVVLQEWNQAWQRRRDLEAAATLSLAGFTVSRMQFGTEDSSPSTLRAEADRQRMVMEHMEGPMQERERVLESRFAAALGMLWWSDPSELTPWLGQRRTELPGWVAIYEAMCAALPSFRELLTHFFAFQTLSVKFANVDDPSAFLTALQSVVPKMLNLLRQIMSTMDGASYPFAENGRVISLNEHLLPGRLPSMPGVSMTSLDAASMRSIGLNMATDASACVAPYVDAFLVLYHRAFAWLAESAERTETHFIGSLSLGSSMEILLPEEFTTQSLGMKSKSPDAIAAWKPPVAA